MKTLLIINNRLGYAGLCLLGILVLFAWHEFRAAKASRMEIVESKMLEKLKAYRQANGRYPDSLQTLVSTNSPQEIQLLADVRLINYQRTNSGFALSYKSWDGYQSFRYETW